MSSNTKQRVNIEDLTRALDYHGPLHLTEIGDAIEDAPARNRLRAYWAAKALQVFVEETGSDTIETAISDLLADLRHLAASSLTEDGKPIDEGVFDDLQDSGLRHWIAEAYDGE